MLMDGAECPNLKLDLLSSTDLTELSIASEVYTDLSVSIVLAFLIRETDQVCTQENDSIFRDRTLTSRLGPSSCWNRHDSPATSPAASSHILNADSLFSVGLFTSKSNAAISTSLTS